MQLGPRRAEQRERSASQIEELDKLKRLIDQLLTLARAEAGQIPLARAPVDLGALAASLVEQLEPVAQARRLDSALRDAIGAVAVDGDAGWLERLLLNLLDNAIKFTPRGRHGRRARRARGRPRAARGAATPASACRPTSLPHVFERFFRADPGAIVRATTAPASASAW